MRAAAAILAITALSFFLFPGHTYLQQDTQIYVPILENQWSGALAGDLLVERPHVNYTLYDELTNALRAVTRAPLRLVLQGEQLFFRALGVAGVYLIALSFGLESALAVVVAAIASLGAAIVGPAVLTVEYEPTPRAFAVPLLLLALGLVLRPRYFAAGSAIAAAFLLHAPTVWPVVLAVLCLAAVDRRALRAIPPVVVAVVALVWIGAAQSVHEPQRLFSVLSASLEQLQRMRASYNYVSTWWAWWMPQYLFFTAVAALGFRRVHASRAQTVLLGALILAGLIAVPVSLLLLEYDKLSVIPQIQPARALLFVTEMAILVSAVAGCRAARSHRRAESAAWFAFALWTPSVPIFFFWPGWRVTLVIAGCAAALALVVASARLWFRAVPALLLAPALACAAGIVNAVPLETAELRALATWADVATPASSLFAFPDAGRDRSPGWFRATALRPVYVDWKGGGQMNYLQEFGVEWWRRWRLLMREPAPAAFYRGLAIDFIVLRHALPAPAVPAFHNPRYFVYATGSH